jgi:hypothetical protein
VGVLTVIMGCSVNPSQLTIASYNLHGLNNGPSFLVDLCNNPLVDLNAIQEHWLTPDNLVILNSIHPEFDAFGISAMTNRLAKEIYRGRSYYGGVAFFGAKIYLNW